MLIATNKTFIEKEFKTNYMFWLNKILIIILSVQAILELESGC